MYGVPNLHLMWGRQQQRTVFPGIGSVSGSGSNSYSKSPVRFDLCFEAAPSSFFLSVRVFVRPNLT